jgi:hypothetical protein
VKTIPLPVRLDKNVQKLLREGARRTPHKKQDLTVFGFSLHCSQSESRISGKIFYHGFHGFHGLKTLLFLSVPSVKSVVEFLCLRLAALRLCARLCFDRTPDSI